MTELSEVVFDFEYEIKIDFGDKYRICGFKAEGASRGMTYAHRDGKEIARFPGVYLDPEQAKCLVIGWWSGRHEIPRSEKIEVAEKLKADGIREIMHEELKPLLALMKRAGFEVLE